MLNLNETAYKEKAPGLLEELEERAMSLGDAEPFTKEIIRLLDEAKSLLAEGKTTESLKKYYEVRKVIEKAERSIRGEPLAWKLLWIEMGYLFLLLLLAYITYRWPNFWLWDGLINLDTQTAWFGSLGGVTIALYGIYSHIQSRDFDPEYQLWYICKPIIGGIFGWFVYLIYFIGLVSVQGKNVKINTPELPYIIAFLAGFSERFTIKIIDRLMAVLITWEEKPGAPPEKKA